MEFTDRGARVYARVTSLEGVEMSVQESSADPAQLWLFTDHAEDIRLDIAGAYALRDALQAFIQEAESVVRETNPMSSVVVEYCGLHPDANSG